MKTDEELKKMSIEELKIESAAYWEFIKKIDGLIKYKEHWE